MVSRVDLGFDSLSQFVVVNDDTRTFVLKGEDDVLDHEFRMPLSESLDSFRWENVDFHRVEYC